MTLERTVGVVRVQFPAVRVVTRRGSGHTPERPVHGRCPRATEEATLAHGTPHYLITTPTPEPGPSLLAASGTVTVLPARPTAPTCADSAHPAASTSS
jgi:hypothetical protein